MTQATGFRKGPFSFRYHIAELTPLINVKELIPSMTDNEVRYNMGKYAIMEHLQETSENSPQADFEDGFINSLITTFTAPALTWDSPMEEVMYWTGVTKALRIVVDYYTKQE